MSQVEIEFTNNTLVYTEQGVQRLVDVLNRPVEPALWAIKWRFNGEPSGISFHASHGAARKFAAEQLDSTSDGPSRLVNVSACILTAVETHGYCWTNLSKFEDAVNYEGETWKH